MKKTYLPLLAAVALAPCFTTLRADEPAPSTPPPAESPAGPPGYGRLQRMADKLNLTDTQRAAMKEVMKQHASEIKPLHESMRAERGRLRAIVTSPKIDETALAAQADKIAAIQRELIIANAHLRADLHGLLTPEQITQAETMRAHARRRFAHAREGFSAWLGQP